MHMCGRPEASGGGGSSPKHYHEDVDSGKEQQQLHKGSRRAAGRGGRAKGQTMPGLSWAACGIGIGALVEGDPVGNPHVGSVAGDLHDDHADQNCHLPFPAARTHVASIGVTRHGAVLQLKVLHVVLWPQRLAVVLLNRKGGKRPWGALAMPVFGQPAKVWHAPLGRAAAAASNTAAGARLRQWLGRCGGGLPRLLCHGAAARRDTGRLLLQARGVGAQNDRP
mmetsp:Transcript_12648/g.35565  ORF Transcript_12648/g.35565 Transcript_12648/m.35565 type:complete len:223 (-) Transcript_12648:2153-2821(-)